MPPDYAMSNVSSQLETSPLLIVYLRGEDLLSLALAIVFARFSVENACLLATWTLILSE